MIIELYATRGMQCQPGKVGGHVFFVEMAGMTQHPSVYEGKHVNKPPLVYGLRKMTGHIQATYKSQSLVAAYTRCVNPCRQRIHEI